MTSTLFILILLALLFTLFVNLCNSQSSAADDAAVLKSLRESLNSPSQLGWLDDENPCNWKNVQCSTDKRVTRIQIGHQNLQGTLPLNLNKLNSLQVFEVQGNQLTGSLPSFAGLKDLKSLLLSNNNFTSVPSDFFSGTTSLQDVYLDYNPFNSWVFPDSLKDASALQTISATSANISGTLPDFFGADTFPSLSSLHLAFNYLEGPLPSTLSGSSIQSLWLNGQMSSFKLNGSIAVLQNMTQLSQVWLHGNSFSGPLPDFTGLTLLKDLSLRDNDLTGPVPDSLVNLTSLRVVNLTNNLLQGKPPQFSSSVQLDMRVDSNSFCVTDPKSECDSRVNDLLEVIQDFGYPKTFSENWKGNDPCNSWKGISCDNGKNITVVNFNGIGLTGIIPPSFSRFTSLQRLILSNNKLYGTIQESLQNLPNLILLDVSNNNINGRVPPFKSNVVVKTEGNPHMGQDAPPPMIPDNKNGSSPGPVSGGKGNLNGNGNGNGTGRTGDGNEKKKSNKIVPIACSIVGVCGFVAAGVAFVICFSKRKRSNKVQSPHDIVIHPRNSGSDDAVKITIAGSSGNGGDGISEMSYNSHGNSGPRDVHIVEAGNMVISIQVLRNVTNNFSEVNILGRGGFGTVYKGELHDGTIIAVKRMESGVMSEKGLDEFKSEISVLTKVRHRHLVALLGYCLDGNERLLVYEYMPQGTLSRYLFNWKEEGLKPLEWMKRLIIALDVARGVEYLHGLAHQSFIHRDLKPSNILLGDDMRAKVADFGLVREAPNGKASIATKLAGTFGYLAPEYAVTGRVSTKIDVFSFGVILMEIITGRKSLDENLPDDSMHLVPWFRRTLNSKDSFHKAIDPTLDILDEETLASINTVAELAGHCSAREPYQRPDMGHAVNVLSSLAELWKPSEPTDPEDMYGIDYDMTLPQAVKKWQALEGMSGYDVTSSSSFVGSNDNTQTSIPTRPSGFADSFTSADGR